MMQTETPAARNTDPPTSHEAAEQHTASGKRAQQRDAVARALIEHGQGGVTSDELAEAAGMDRYLVARRLPELLTRNRAFVRGYKESPERRKSTISGRAAMVWRPVGVKS